MAASKLVRVQKTLKDIEQAYDRLKDLLDDHTNDITNVPRSYTFSKRYRKMEKYMIHLEMAWECLCYSKAALENIVEMETKKATQEPDEDNGKEKIKKKIKEKLPPGNFIVEEPDEWWVNETENE